LRISGDAEIRAAEIDANRVAGRVHGVRASASKTAKVIEGQRQAAKICEQRGPFRMIEKVTRKHYT